MYLDIDPHDGIQEMIFLDMLRKIKYKGLIMCDDIHINSGMEVFWSNITEEKFDLSHIGHCHPNGQIYGTGLIVFK